jgi:hypothetical protein
VPHVVLIDPFHGVDVGLVVYAEVGSEDIVVGVGTVACLSPKKSSKSSSFVLDEGLVFYEVTRSSCMCEEYPSNAV